MKEVLEAIQEIKIALKEIKGHLINAPKSVESGLQEKWIDGQEMMMTLHISKRTLQTLRDTGILKYSRINGKLFYKVSDLEKLLEKNYSQSKSSQNER